MEKSIETIWKEGFLKKDALVALKINDLYTRKSIHIIDTFTRMFKINLKAIVVFSFVVLPVSFFIKIPVFGVLMFLVLNVIVIVNKKLLKGLNAIDKNVSSYQYLKTFDNWMKAQILTNMKMSRFIYPSVFLTVLVGFWFSSSFQETFHETLGSHQIYFLKGLPVFWILGILSITGLLAYFGGVLYKLDLKIVYGRVLKKLDEIIAEMEDLQS